MLQTTTQHNTTQKHQGSRVLAHYAAETHNGYLFWNGLCQTGTDSEGDFHADTNALISRAIEEQWGSYASFCEDFKVHAQSTLGSGYVWLCYESSMEVREQAMVKKFDASEEDKTPEEAVLSITSGEEAVEKPSGETDATEGTDTAAEGTEGTEGEAKDRDITEQVDLRPEDPATPQTPTEEILSRLKFRDSTGKLQGYRLKIVTTLKSESPLTSGFKVCQSKWSRAACKTSSRTLQCVCLTPRFARLPPSSLPFPPFLPSLHHHHLFFHFAASFRKNVASQNQNGGAGYFAFIRHNACGRKLCRGAGEMSCSVQRVPRSADSMKSNTFKFSIFQTHHSPSSESTSLPRTLSTRPSSQTQSRRTPKHGVLCLAASTTSLTGMNCNTLAPALFPTTPRG